MNRGEPLYGSLRAAAVAVLLVFSGTARTTGPNASAQIAPCEPNPVVCENQSPGTPSSQWDVTGAGDPSIQGFATDISVNRGQTVFFKINTPALAYTIDIYRLGYYGGAGARTMTIAPIIPSAALPQSQPACLTNPATGLFDCSNWAVSASWDTTGATSGIYLAKLTRTDIGGDSHIVFVVRDDTRQADVVVQTSDTTWQAYNRYGSGSLYCGGPVSNAGTVYGFACPGRAAKVSYNRPIDTRDHDPQSFLFNAEYPMVRWLEANGYDIKYISGVDTERRAADLVGAQKPKAFFSVGHDEYWSAGQRASVEAARNAGVNLAFFSGNEIYWKTRWETSLDSTTPFRTLVSYKDTLGGIKLDPMPGVTTGTWRDTRFSPPVADGGRPENGLIGTIWTVNSGTTSISVPASMASLRFWRNTTVAALTSGSETLGTGTLGYEWDEDLPNGARPDGLIHLSSTTVNGVEKILDFGETVGIGTATHNLTLYKHAGGALVFGAGTVQWSWGLDDVHDRGSAPPSLAMQQATMNLLSDMGAQPGTAQIDLTASSGSSDTTKPTSVITSPVSGGSIEGGFPVTIAGTAADSGGVVAGVEVSVDGGATWRRATGRQNWTYAWQVTGIGAVVLKSRATDDSGNLETPATGTPVTLTCPCSLWDPAITTPATVDSNDPGAVELGVKFRTDDSGFITGLRFYKSAANTGTHVGRVYTVSGALLGTAMFTNETASGWQQAAFGDPINVAANTTYVASYHTNTGHYSTTAQYFANTGVDAPPLHALSNATALNGVYAYGSGGFPASSFNASNYWVDVIFSTAVGEGDTTPPAVSAVAPASGTTGVGSGINPTLTFSESIAPATISTSTIELRDGANVPVTGSVSYDAATRIASFDPALALAPSSAYTVVAKGGTSGPRVTDLAGNPMASTFTSAFTTAAPGACPCSIWDPAVAVPAIADAADGGAVELGVKFRAEADGFITGLRYYKSAANTGTHVANLWTAAGALVSTATFAGETASGWQEATFAPAVPITANTQYVASYHTNAGHYSVTGGYFAGAGVDTPPLHALANAASANGVYRYGASGFPTATYNATNYWVDVVFDTSGPSDTTPPTVISNSPAAGASGVAASTNVTATFSEPISTATVNTGTFELRNAANAIVAATVTFDVATRTAGLRPTAALAAGAVYTARLHGGGTDPRIKDVAGNALAADVSWSFTTAAAGSCPCSLWDSPVIGVPDAGDASAVELGVKFRADVDGFITGIRYYKSAANTGTHAGNLWAIGGTRLATATFANETSTGWQVVTFTTPVAVTANTTYVASYHTDSGHYAATSAYFAAGLDSPPLHTIPNGTSPNGVYQYGASGFPTGSYNATNYWVDVVFHTTAGADTTPPTVTSTIPVAGAKNVSTTAAVTATFNEALDPATVNTATFELRNAANLVITSTVSYEAATRSARLTPDAGLDPDAAYTARLHGGMTNPRITDVAGNALEADLVWSFTTRPLTTTLVDTSVADFTRGTLDAGGYIGAAAGGEVLLMPAIGAEFSGASLPAGWSISPWGGGSSAAISGGVMSVDGAFVSTSAMFLPGRSLEFTATFSGHPYQHAGFALTLGEGLWAMFSSSGGDAVYARTNNGSTAMNTLIPGSLFGTPHRFRIDWSATQVDFAIDGVQVATHAIGISASMRPVASDYNGDGNALAIDWMRLTPYAGASTYLSGIFDASATSTWIAATMSGETPAGTAALLSVRYGDSPVPDGSWTAFTPVTGPLEGTSRYLQYRLQLTTSANGQTPVIHDVTIDLKR